MLSVARCADDHRNGRMPSGGDFSGVCLFLMAAEFVAQRRQQLVGKIIVTAGTESLVERGAEAVSYTHLVCVEGAGQIEHDGVTYAIERGEVWLLPAVVGICHFRPSDGVNLLEIACPAR